MEGAEEKEHYTTCTRDRLRPHLERENYLAYVQAYYQLHNHPSPITHGCYLVNGLCLPVRDILPPLPPLYLACKSWGRVHRHSSSESEDSSGSSECSSVSDFCSDKDL